MVAYMDIGDRATQDAVAEEVLTMHGAIGSAKGWRSLLNELSEEEQQEFEKVHREEIAEVIGNDAYMDVGSRATQEQLPTGVWFNTEVLIAVGEMIFVNDSHLSPTPLITVFITIKSVPNPQ